MSRATYSSNRFLFITYPYFESMESSVMILHVLKKFNERNKEYFWLRKISSKVENKTLFTFKFIMYKTISEYATIYTFEGLYIAGEVR